MGVLAWGLEEVTGLAGVREIHSMKARDIFRCRKCVDRKGMVL